MDSHTTYYASKGSDLCSYPVNLHYPREYRDSLEQLRNLAIVTPSGAHIPMQRVVKVYISTGPGLIRSENARLNGWIYEDVIGRDIGSFD